MVALRSLAITAAFLSTTLIVPVSAGKCYPASAGTCAPGQELTTPLGTDVFACIQASGTYFLPDGGSASDHCIDAATSIGTCYTENSDCTGASAPKSISACYYDPNRKSYQDSGTGACVILGTGACGSASCGGDPHFTTWSGQHFNYHGQCDLVLMHAPEFHRNQGFDLHVRTKVEGVYSIVTAAAIQLGDSVLEFDHETVGEPKMYFNRDEKPTTDLPLVAGNFSVSVRQLHNDDLNADVAIYEIGMRGRALVTIEVLNQWVMVSVKALEKDLAGSMGLLGSYPKGEMIARDGITDLSINRNAFGAEWQVRADEPQLFHWTPDDHPQAPHQSCRLPDHGGDVHSYLRTRRAETYKTAMEVCMKEGVTGADLDDCVFDVSMTGSPTLAAAWWGKEQSNA